MKWSSASERAPLRPRRSVSLKCRGSYRPSSSQMRVPVMPNSSSRWCQSAELGARREHSRPSTIPARPSDTSATICWKPSRSAADAPDWPWSTSITVIWRASQPSAIALPRRSYWRTADSVLWMTCLRLDWRTYKIAVLDRWAAVTFDAAVSGSIGSPSQMSSRLRGRAGGGERDGRQDVDELGGHRGREPGGLGGVCAGRLAVGCCRARSGGGQAGQGVPPGGDALAGEHAEPGRERLGARGQGGMTQLLVAGIQPPAGNAILAGIRTVLRFSSRVAR